MIEKTEAIVLRIFPYSRTSHIVSWLTREGVQLTTSIKGAARPKSAFLGQYDLFYTCELLYYTRNNNGVHIARECTPLAPREMFRTNWRAAQCASWFTALAYHASGSHCADPALYRLLIETLDFISCSPFAPPLVVFARFEAKLLELNGLRPNFALCPYCNDDPDAFRFNLAAGSRHCPEHSYRDPTDPILTISKRTIALYHEVLKSNSLGPQSSIAQVNGPAVYALLRFLGLFMRYHFDHVPIDGRAIALKALSGPRQL